jgi:hypothetical protein
VAAPEDAALQRCEPVLQAGHLLLGCQVVLQEVLGAARTQHPLNGRGDWKADSGPLAIRIAPEDSGRRLPEADRPCSLAESTDVHGRWRWRIAALVVAVSPTAATADKNAYWVMVAKIWSGTPSTTPSAKAKQLAAAVSAQRPVSSAQHGPTISRPIRIRRGPLAASQAATAEHRMKLSFHRRPTLQPGSSDSRRHSRARLVVHDAVDPLGLLRSIRDALRPGGRYLCLEINCSPDPAGNTGPIATLLYGFSILYCMTTSLANGGEGLGTLGLPEPALRNLAGKAGFAQVRRVEMDNPFNTLYELAR